MSVILFAALFAVCADPRRSPKIEAAPIPQESRPDAATNIPSQADGVVIVLGTEIKEGEFVPVNEIVAVKIDGETKRFRRLKVGDKVEEGQVIGRLDDSLARLDVEVAKAKLAAAESKQRAAENVRDEANTRMKVLEQLQVRAPGSVAPSEMREAQLSVVRYTEDAITAVAEVKVAAAQLKRAEYILTHYQIRAVRGEVVAILKRRGEAARAYETVVRIRPDDKEK
jgi:multidrug efflux pump subunit AcrA (membrane-fusion protein)